MTQVAARLMRGRPVRPAPADRHRLTASTGLAALGLDALASCAYGPESIVLVLSVAGAAGIGLTVPVTLVIVGLLAVLVICYRQVIAAYPDGGGAYTVARDNLGRRAGLVAAASLLVDYVLNVAVSVAAGVAALTSAFPALLPWTVELCIGVLLLVTGVNLRGVVTGGKLFALPALVFVGSLVVLIVVGLFRGGPWSASAGWPKRACPRHCRWATGQLPCTSRSVRTARTARRPTHSRIAGRSGARTSPWSCYLPSTSAVNRAVCSGRPEVAAPR